MTEQWQELKETIKELRYSNGDLTQQEVCSFLGVYMETLEKQMQESTYAKGTIIKSALKYLVKRQIEEGSVGFAVDNDHDHDCCWDDVLVWIETQPSEDCISRKYIEPIVEELENICINGDEHILSLLSNIKNAPLVTPERPKGKWIKCKSRFGTEYFKCSECGRKLNWIDSDDNYCNSCGSDNSESTKELYKAKLAEIIGGGEE